MPPYRAIAKGPGDFLFFGEDTLFQRPLDGSPNLGHGLVQSGLGLLTLPLDGGRRASSWISGAFYSLREPVRISIRRGHFEVTPGIMH